MEACEPGEACEAGGRGGRACAGEPDGEYRGSAGERDGAYAGEREGAYAGDRGGNAAEAQVVFGEGAVFKKVGEGREAEYVANGGYACAAGERTETVYAGDGVLFGSESSV